jgi:hypothetical protein
LRWHDVWRRATATLAILAYRRSRTLEILDVDALEAARLRSADPATPAHTRGDDDESGRTFRHLVGGLVVSYR